MENKDLEKLLKENISSEVSIPNDLDRKIRLKMDKIIEKKNSTLILVLITINTLFVILFSVYFWIISSTGIQKIAIVFTDISFISLFICFYVINKQTQVEKEVRI